MWPENERVFVHLKKQSKLLLFAFNIRGQILLELANKYITPPYKSSALD